MTFEHYYIKESAEPVAGIAVQAYLTKYGSVPVVTFLISSKQHGNIAGVAYRYQGEKIIEPPVTAHTFYDLGGAEMYKLQLLCKRLVKTLKVSTLKGTTAETAKPIFVLTKDK